VLIFGLGNRLIHVLDLGKTIVIMELGYSFIKKVRSYAAGRSSVESKAAVQC
jgi:hypothetical protein